MVPNDIFHQAYFYFSASYLLSNLSPLLLIISKVCALLTCTVLVLKSFPFYTVGHVIYYRPLVPVILVVNFKGNDTLLQQIVATNDR